MTTSDLRFNLSGSAGHRVDVMFLADATGSMGPAMHDVTANIISAYNAFQRKTGWNIQLGISFYRDRGDRQPIAVLQTITGQQELIQAAANKLVADGGGDRPEAQVAALTHLATRAHAGWRPGATRIIAWFGDEPGHDPVTIGSVTYTAEGAISALLDNNVQVCAFSMLPSNALDETKQATRITSACDGIAPPDNRFVSYKVTQPGVVASIFNFIRHDVP